MGVVLEVSEEGDAGTIREVRRRVACLRCAAAVPGGLCDDGRDCRPAWLLQLILRNGRFKAFDMHCASLMTHLEVLSLSNNLFKDILGFHHFSALTEVCVRVLLSVLPFHDSLASLLVVPLSAAEPELQQCVGPVAAAGAVAVAQLAEQRCVTSVCDVTSQ
jgi:hypothetical protein